MKADIHESGLIMGMQAWKDHLEQSIPKVHPKRAPVNGECTHMRVLLNNFQAADTHKPGWFTGVDPIFGSPGIEDLIIRCEFDKYYLQRANFCERSAFFAAACDGVFEKSTITLQGDDPPTVCRMLTYLHTLAYDDEGEAASIEHYMVNGMEAVTPQALTTRTTSLGAEEHLRVEEQLRHVKLMNNVAVYAVAQKYGIGALRELASTKFCELLRLKTSTHELPSLIDAVFGTTSVTDPRLRDATVEYCTQYSTKIVADKSVCISIRDHGELGLGMLQKMIEEKKQMSKQIKQVQACDKVYFSEVRGFKARLWDVMSMADAIDIPNKAGDAASHSFAKYSLKRLCSSIRTLIGVKD